MNRAILFFLGLLMGVLICVLLFYYDVKIFEAKHTKCNEKEIITIITTDTVFVEIPFKPKKQNIENEIADSVAVSYVEDEYPENETAIYESEFFLDGDDQNSVFSDRLLQTKTVKVKLLPQEQQEVKPPDNFFQFFEIQQWSTPIKNKTTYVRDNNMLKIKGMEIDNVSVVFWNNSYFFEKDNRYYSIHETKSYEKLNLVQIPQ